MALLNQQLASALGRPELAFGNAFRPVSIQAQPAGFQADVSGTGTLGGSLSGPVLGLIVLVVGLGAFVYWIHPHLA